jgi:hypothetical protein
MNKRKLTKILALEIPVVFITTTYLTKFILWACDEIRVTREARKISNEITAMLEMIEAVRKETDKQKEAENE